MRRKPSVQMTVLTGSAILLGAALAANGALAQGPAPQAVPAPSPVPAAPSDAAMQAELQTSCTTCHDLSPLATHPRTPDEWGTVLGRMAGYNSALANLDLKALQAYLVQKYPAPAR